MRLDIPFLTYSEIGKRAHEFLIQYHPSFETPIPIMDIIDVKMGIDIFPFPRLYKDHRQNGFLTKDRKTIYVDEYQYEEFNEKLRYTLAHEIGHYILHRRFYEDLSFSTVNEYVEWRMNVTPEEMSWFDTHADWFAGHVLVPTSQLEKICNEVVDRHREIFSKMEIIPEDIWSYIANEVAQSFEVNPPVAEIRIKKEGIPEKIPIR